VANNTAPQVHYSDGVRCKAHVKKTSEWREQVPIFLKKIVHHSTSTVDGILSVLTSLHVWVAISISSGVMHLSAMEQTKTAVVQLQDRAGIRSIVTCKHFRHSNMHGVYFMNAYYYLRDSQCGGTASATTAQCFFTIAHLSFVAAIWVCDLSISKCCLFTSRVRFATRLVLLVKKYCVCDIDMHVWHGLHYTICM